MESNAAVPEQTREERKLLEASVGSRRKGSGGPSSSPAKDPESLGASPFPIKCSCYNSLLSPTPAHSPIPLSPFLTTYYIVYYHAVA